MTKQAVKCQFVEPLLKKKRGQGVVKVVLKKGQQTLSENGTSIVRKSGKLTNHDGVQKKPSSTF